MPSSRQQYVVLPGYALLADHVDTDLQTRTYLVHPWNSTRGPSVVLDATYYKYIVPSTFTPTKNATFSVSALDLNNKMSIEWNGTVVTLTLPTGNYTVSTFNTALQAQCNANFMYLRNASNQPVYFMRFEDTAVGIRFVIDPVNLDGVYPSGWSVPSGAPLSRWPYVSTNPSPSLTVMNFSTDLFGDVVGFLQGKYPNAPDNTPMSRHRTFCPVGRTTTTRCTRPCRNFTHRRTWDWRRSFPSARGCPWTTTL